MNLSWSFGTCAALDQCPEFKVDDGDHDDQEREQDVVGKVKLGRLAFVDPGDEEEIAQTCTARTPLLMSSELSIFIIS